MRQDTTEPWGMKRPAVIIEDEDRPELRIPEGVGDIDEFRRWAESDEFPTTGRVDFLQGTVEVDMSPEDLQTHGQPKLELVLYIGTIVKRGNLGQVFTDRSRVTHPAVGLSCEPDIVFVSIDALRSGRARYTSISDRTGKLMEIEGSPTLVVEIVSDSSVNKDLSRLPVLYAEAGISELWLLDARGDELRFEIRCLGDREWHPSSVDPNGYQESRVLGRWVQIRREPWEFPGTWQYRVDDAADA